MRPHLLMKFSRNAEVDPSDAAVEPFAIELEAWHVCLEAGDS